VVVLQYPDITGFLVEIHCIDEEELFSAPNKVEEVKAQRPAIYDLHIRRKGIPFLYGIDYMNPDSLVP